MSDRTPNATPPSPSASSGNAVGQAPMVGWYDPMQLLRTGSDVAASILFGRRADYRLMEAVASPKIQIDPVGCVAEGDRWVDVDDDVWIDYVSDTGDGWNSTYAVAKTVAAAELRLERPDGSTEVTRRGALLILGGDAVYPVASRAEYKRRLVAPFEAALKNTQKPHPLVRAVPGNHDWYDSLVSFIRLFSTHDFFAGWRARQTRSYFAVRLPRGWWLVGTDMQLDSDIDEPQVDFFRSVAKRMLPDDRVILCNAEPHWIYAHIYGAVDADITESNLAFLENKVFDRRVVVFLAGDLHHYRRHAAPDGRQKITAGGGGAFLHPTHGPDVSKLDGGYTLQASFPPAGESRRLCWRNVAFPLLNWKFGVVPGLLYLLTSWSAMTDVSNKGLNQLDLTLLQAINAGLKNPVAAFWFAALFLGFWLFTDTHSRWYRFTGGTAHALAHMIAAFLIGWGATVVTVSEDPLHFLGYTIDRDFGSTFQLLSAGAIIFVGGWIAGSLIMGLYLLISLNVFKRHTNEAFSSLKIPDWKSFLRLRIDREGTLTIFPIGIRRVPRRWKELATSGSGPRYDADDPRGTAPELIEAPFDVAGPDLSRRLSK